MKKPDIIFECRKCGHNLYVSIKNKLHKIEKTDCPACGEEPERNWIFVCFGNFDEL